ncbi:glycosyltransferase [Eggerthella lenta]|uniref:Glycosyl transferase family 1 domain-containing protein n=1 Tax=Eggerthella lenta TaxID=84112 RepID=A0A369M4P2_EGGLN|nr:glycosyltransferase [Eggerthella lenta]MDB1805543.1 glycosyltransferase [Eggerthella lenta]RDB66701.1 hypothetical protein C1875_13805 [Eggerthella lenta]
MAERKRIGIIGRIDPSESMFDGQTVKTRTIWKLMVEHFGADSVVAVDTLDYSKKPLKVAWNLLRCLVSCRDIVVLLSRGGRKIIFPVLSFASNRFGRNIFHSLIGGWLSRDIDEDERGVLVNYLNSFKVNWVETHELVAALAARGVRNAEYLPNFKLIAPISKLPEEALHSPVRLCTFSRVQERKGISNAIESVDAVNARYGRQAAMLDIYGPIDADYEHEFRKLLGNSTSSSYKGCVRAEESVSTLSTYDALLFPTEWVMEGIPGTVIDAFHAGLPVISSRWRYYEELLEDGKTGLSYPFEHCEMLEDALFRFLELDTGTVGLMREECLSRAQRYSASSAFSQMSAAIEGEGNR